MRLFNHCPDHIKLILAFVGIILIQQNKKQASHALLVLLYAVILGGCLSPSDKHESDAYTVPGNDWDELLPNESGHIIDAGVSTGWRKHKVVSPQSNGLMNPFFDAIPTGDGNIQFVYYNYDGQLDDNGQFEFNLQHLVWNPQTNGPYMGRASSTITTVNHSDHISLGQDKHNQLYLAYRGGEVKACNGAKVMADTMFSVFDGVNWQEYLGAQGYVARSAGPFENGHAGANVKLAIDGNANVHMIYQFMYEGCDATNFAFPDLFYVHKQPFQFDMDNRQPADIEEQVSGNDYVTGGNAQNDTGTITDLVIDQNDNPVVFYYEQSATLGKGLFVSYKSNGQWLKESINSDCIVSDVSAVTNPNGDLYVAYVAQACDDDTDTRFSLRFAKKEFNSLSQSTSWQDSYLEEGVLVGGLGRHLSMTMDNMARPAIAYYELATYDEVELNKLKLIRFDESWQVSKALLSQGLQLGLHNKIWLAQDGKLNVASYSAANSAIYLLTEN